MCRDPHQQYNLTALKFFKLLVHTLYGWNYENDQISTPSISPKSDSSRYSGKQWEK